MAMTEAQLERIKKRGIKGPSPSEKRFPFPIPNGWFSVGNAADLKPGETRNVHYFGRDLVVWREQGSGAPHVLDAYCAHLGAHLGVGPGAPESREPGPGLVRGNCLVCPFHNWHYDGSGRVTAIPYAKTDRIPEKARVRAYPTIERNGILFAWHHALGEAPQWELPLLSEFGDPDWVGPIYTERYIDVALQVMMENDQDAPHFVYVHGRESIPEQDEVFEGRMKITRATSLTGAAFTREIHQIGYGVLRVGDEFIFQAASTPIDEAHTHQQWIFAYRKSMGDEAGRAMIDAFSKSGIYQDIPIWEHMLYREEPVLVKGDGQIMQFRRWAQQFYSEPT